MGNKNQPSTFSLTGIRADLHIPMATVLQPLRESLKNVPDTNLASHCLRRAIRDAPKAEGENK